MLGGMLRVSALALPVVLVAACGSSPPEVASAQAKASAARMACDGATLKAGDAEYCVMKTRRNFDDARQDCERMGGRLAVFDGNGKDNALFSAIRSPWGYGSGMWLGCSDSEQEGTWTCSGKPMAFTSWAPGQPDNQDALDDCVEWLADSGKWNDAPCAWKLGYLCRGDGALKCDGHRFAAGGATFCAHTDAREWEGAKKACADAGGSLAAPATAQESDAIFAALKLPSAIPSWEPEQGVWIGLTDQAEEGKFAWVNGRPLERSNWRPGQPDNAGDQDCVTLTLTDGKWGDLDCGTPLPYVCEPK
jgi:hypothetical protein